MTYSYLRPIIPLENNVLGVDCSRYRIIIVVVVVEEVTTDTYTEEEDHEDKENIYMD